jgi:hypothetical protein
LIEIKNNDCFPSRSKPFAWPLPLRGYCVFNADAAGFCRGKAVRLQPVSATLGGYGQLSS